MLSESRLEKRTLGSSNNQTEKDYQDTSNNDTLYNTIALALSGAAGYGLYKSGVLKVIAKPMLEIADKIAKEGTDKASVTMSTIKEWANMKHLNETQLKFTNQRWSAAKNSIFRRRDTTFAYDLFEDLKDIFSGNMRFKNMRNIIQDSVEDINLLHNMIKTRQKELPSKLKNTINTDLYDKLKNLDTFATTITHEDGLNTARAYRSKYMKELINELTLTPKQAAQELRESGYRKATLKDFGKIVHEDGIDKFVANPDAKIDLNYSMNDKGESLVDRINEVLRNSNNRYMNSDGKVVSLAANDWQDLIVDSAIRIDEAGNVIDYRMTKEAIIGFKRSVANDFRLPVVQFNPFKSLRGWDKAGRKTPFAGYISHNQYMPSITGEGGRETTIGQWLGKTLGKEYEESNIAVINGKAYVKNLNSQTDDLIEVSSDLRLYNITYSDGAYGLKPGLNAERQIAGLDLGHSTFEFNSGRYKNKEEFNAIWDKYAEELQTKYNITPNKFQEAKFKFGQILDIGFTESRPDKEPEVLGLDSSSSIDEWTNKLLETLFGSKPLRTTGFEYDTVQKMAEETRKFTFKNIWFKEEAFNEFTTSNGRKFKPNIYVAQKEGYKFNNVIDAIKSGNEENIKDATKRFVYQFGAGRNPLTNEMSEYFTRYSTGPWIVLNQLSEGLGILGLSTESKSSSGAILFNLLAKRALPVYAALQVPGMINYFSEPIFGKDEDGNPDNLGKFIMRGVSKFDVGAHHAMDLVGATKFFKFMGEMTPGSDQINELPGIYQLGLGQTAEERKDYIENGYDPIRKGRWWGAGNTPFTGGKIMYFRPNIYRRVQADVDFSDSKWGSRQEYYNNTWYPNPINPFAPINHFITNRNYYDKKHYYDRPYLETSPEGSNIPIIGPLFSSTIGKIINPPQKMHMEYWVNGLQPASEEPNSLLTEGTLTSSRPAYSNSEYDINTFQGIETKAANAAATNSQSLYTSAYHAKQMTSRTITDNAGITFQERSILPERTYDRYPGNPYEVYSTPSGNLTVVDVPDELNLYNVNQDLRRWSINKVIGTNQRVNLIDSFQGPGIPIGNDSPSIDNAFLYGLGEQYEWLGDVAGLKGFALQQFITGHANEKARIIENSGYAYSVNNDFWEANLGGLGGNLSEITRRFIPERNKNTEYINPIRNTMPDWMPGSNYFTDFKHGDPYSKVPNGEERLPGEGYERLHNINMNLNIGSSFIGYSRADIVKHLLGQDGYMSSFTEDTLNKGTEIHTQIEQEWKDTGFAIDTEGEIKDKRNGIIGYYDAMIKDPTSKTGVGIVDIKTTSAKKLDEIRKSGKPLEHHQKQVNYYLWGTKNTESNGYIYYVDKENLNNNYMVGFKYDEDLLKDTFNNLYGARQDIKTGLATEQIGRGELYSVLDKFRVLADVAPYSQEYKDMSAMLSNEKLTPEEQEEASRIRDRVTKQKEPLRVYDYKFKTSNLKYETVTVADIIDNNTIVTKEYGKEHSIKFAGINVSESNSEYYKTWDEEYTDKRGRKRTRKTGITMNDAAKKEMRKYIRPGSKIKIGYDADEYNKYSKDSTHSIRAVVKSNGINVNQRLLNKGFAKEKEEDNSPAAINARYTKGEIAFGSTMERITHSIADIPFIGNKLFQVRSPYEQYRKREVYGKDFQSWNNPVRDMVIPSIQENIANNKFGGLGGIVVGAFIGSLFGKSPFGKVVGTVLGGTIPAIGKALVAPQYSKDRDWRPKRRRDQEELNEYVDTLKYVKNMRLYNQYKTKALKEDHFNVDKFIESKESQGVYNKLKQQELIDYKRKVKLDFKHRGRYNFKYGEPKYVEQGMDYKTTISAINKEIAEIQGSRKVTKIPKNALLAIDYKQQADKTMYAYNPGDSLVNIMSALPKKERQYFKHFMDAPEEEKEKILKIAPSYLRRALQSTWGMPVDKKPSLDEYFQKHGLPDESWIGWNENTNIDDVKVKLVHQNNLDPGEFDIWDDNERQADQTNIPIPKINAHNSARQVQMKLNNILGHAGYQDIQMSFVSSNENKTSLNIKRDARPDIENQIQNLEIV